MALAAAQRALNLVALAALWDLTPILRTTPLRRLALVVPGLLGTTVAFLVLARRLWLHVPE